MVVFFANPICPYQVAVFVPSPLHTYSLHVCIPSTNHPSLIVSVFPVPLPIPHSYLYYSVCYPYPMVALPQCALHLPYGSLTPVCFTLTPWLPLPQCALPLPHGCLCSQSHVPLPHSCLYSQSRVPFNLPLHCGCLTIPCTLTSSLVVVLPSVPCTLTPWLSYTQPHVPLPCGCLTPQSRVPLSCGCLTLSPVYPYLLVVLPPVPCTLTPWLSYPQSHVPLPCGCWPACGCCCTGAIRVWFSVTSTWSGAAFWSFSASPLLFTFAIS